MNAGKPLNVGRFQNNGGFGISSSYFRKGCAVTRISTRSRSSRSSRRTSVQVQGKNVLERLGSFFGRKKKKNTEQVVEVVEPAPPARENAVLVIGGTGRVGRQVVKELLSTGATVVAGVRSAERMTGVLEELDVTDSEHLIIDEGVDITDESTLSQDLFSGVVSVINCAGKGKESSAEDIDYKGVQNLVEAAEKYMSKPEPLSGDLVQIVTEEDLSNWTSYDDTLMDGQSESSMELLEDGTGCAITGNLVMDKGNFCGRKMSLPSSQDFSAFDGISLRIRGDGQIFKINIKTEIQQDSPGKSYQAAFETIKNEWVTVQIPWKEFVPVFLRNCDPDQPPLDASQVTGVSFVHSSNYFNGMPNTSVRPGPFRLEISGGIGLFKAERPMVTILSSSGVERNAVIGDDQELRNADIPIIKLNPGGVLNYKYKGEIAVRSSNLPYSIVRSTGFRDSQKDCLLEATQTDSFVGLMTPKDVGKVLVEASRSPDAAYKTFAVRRQLGEEAQEKEMQPEDYRRLFLGQVHDWQRAKVGLPHFPSYVDPPPPPTGEEKEAIVKEAVETMEANSAIA